jgi:PEGA domain
MGVTSPRAAPALTLLVVLSGCEVGLPHAARPTMSFRVHGAPPDATVTIDEEMVGSLAVVAARGVALPEGTHQVTVQAPGYFPWDRLVESKSAESKRTDLAVDLVRVPE